MTLAQFLPKEPTFTSEELLRFANIFDNAGQIFLGIMVLTPFVSGFDRGRVPMITLGIAATALCWFLSWQLTRKAIRL